MGVFALTGGCLWALQPVVMDRRGGSAECAVCARAICQCVSVTAGHQGHSPGVGGSPRPLPTLTRCSFPSEPHGWRTVSCPLLCCVLLPPASSPTPRAAPADARPPWAGQVGLPLGGGIRSTLSPLLLCASRIWWDLESAPHPALARHLISQKCSSPGFTLLLLLAPAPHLPAF